MSKRKRNIIIVAAIVGVLVLVFGITNLVFGILGSQKQTGDMRGVDWSADSEFNADNVRTYDMGNEEFKILCLTDLQRKNSGTAVKFLGINYLLDWASSPKIKKIVKDAAPDLIVVLGDNVANKCNDLEMKHFVKQMDSFGVPYAVLFGNHDDEGRADKATVAKIVSEGKNSIFEYGPNDLHGAGNYIINLKRSDKIDYSLFVMDSGNHITTPDGTGVYDGINAKQVEWYEWAMRGLTAANGGEAVRNMAFFHIPIPEYGQIREYELGKRAEISSSSYYNHGFFDSFKANGGTHMFVGHDHTNNFVGTLDGVKLGYVQKSSYNSYFKGDMLGGTLITLKPDGDVALELRDF